MDENEIVIKIDKTEFVNDAIHNAIADELRKYKIQDIIHNEIISQISKNYSNELLCQLSNKELKECIINGACEAIKNKLNDMKCYIV